MTAIRSRYSQVASEGISFDPDDPRNTHVDCVSQTKQEFKDDCDLNVILKRYRETGLIDVPVHEMIYGDFSNVEDFQKAQNLVSRVGEMFERLPATTRAYFANSPAEFLSFVNDQHNAGRAKDLGLSEFFSSVQLDPNEGQAVSESVLQPVKGNKDSSGNSGGTSGSNP